MKVKLILLLLLIQISTALSQQKITVLDSLTKTPVAYAHITAENGELLYISDVKGKVEIKELFKDNLKVKVNHVGYLPKEFILTKGNINDSILLNENSLLLDTVSVTVSAKKITDNLIIKGYFRSFQLLNNEVEYFADGIVEYFIPKGSHRDRMAETNVIKQRVLGNEVLLNDRKKTTFNIDLDDFGPPFISESPTLEVLNKKFKFLKDNEGTNELNIYDKEYLIGTFRHRPENLISYLNIDIDYSDRKKVRKILGHRIKYVQDIYSEVYKNGSPELDKNSYENLYKKFEYKKVLKKHKKEKEFKEIEVFSEFYVLEKYYLSDDEVEDLNNVNFYQNMYENNIDDDFILFVKDFDISPLPKYVIESIESKLQPIEDIYCNTCN